MKVGDRGRVVLPAELRRDAGYSQGTTLIAIGSDDGVVLLTRDQLEERVQAGLQGKGLVDELIGERRAAARAEDRV